MHTQSYLFITSLWSPFFLDSRYCFYIACHILSSVWHRHLLMCYFCSHSSVPGGRVKTALVGDMSLTDYLWCHVLHVLLPSGVSDSHLFAVMLLVSQSSFAFSQTLKAGLIVSGGLLSRCEGSILRLVQSQDPSLSLASAGCVIGTYQQRPVQRAGQALPCVV